MNFPLYIAKRYLFSKSSNNTINIITIIAALGVIIGAMALFIVLSGFSGLKAFSVGLLQTSDPDFKITAAKGKSFEFTSNILDILAETEGIEQLTQVVEERAFFEFKGKTEVAYIKGIEENYIKINNLDTAIVIGRWLDFDGSNQAIVGNAISNKLSMGINDYLQPLKIYVPKPGLGYISSVQSDISSINVQPIGIYSLNEEIDRKFVFIPLQLAQKLLGYKPYQISAIEVSVINSDTRSSIISNLQKQLGNHFTIQTREQMNGAFYRMLNIENLFAYVLSTFVLILFMVNLIGAMTIIIHNKKENIATINNLGLDFTRIKKIFFLQGFLLSFFGLLIGLSLGIILILLQKQFGMFMITSSMAFPVEFKATNVIVVFFTILILGYFAAKIASSRITKNVAS